MLQRTYLNDAITSPMGDTRTTLDAVARLPLPSHTRSSMWPRRQHSGTVHNSVTLSENECILIKAIPRFLLAHSPINLVLPVLVKWPALVTGP